VILVKDFVSNRPIQHIEEFKQNVKEFVLARPIKATKKKNRRKEIEQLNQKKLLYEEEIRRN